VDASAWDKVNTYATFAPNNVWSWTLGQRYLRENAFYPNETEGINFVYSSIYWRAGENWGLRASTTTTSTPAFCRAAVRFIATCEAGPWPSFRVLENAGRNGTDYGGAITFSLKSLPRYGLGTTSTSRRSCSVIRAVLRSHFQFEVRSSRCDDPAHVQWVAGRWTKFAPERHGAAARSLPSLQQAASWSGAVRAPARNLFLRTAQENSATKPGYREGGRRAGRREPGRKRKGAVRKTAPFMKTFRADYFFFALSSSAMNFWGPPGR
jgi:hypothetical protein